MCCLAAITTKLKKLQVKYKTKKDNNIKSFSFFSTEIFILESIYKGISTSTNNDKIKTIKKSINGSKLRILVIRLDQKPKLIQI